MTMDSENENAIKEAIRFYVRAYLKDQGNHNQDEKEEEEVRISNNVYEDIHKSVEQRVNKSNGESPYNIMASYMDLIGLYIK